MVNLMLPRCANPKYKFLFSKPFNKEFLFVSSLYDKQKNKFQASSSD